MLSMRDIIDFAAMSEGLAQESNSPNINLSDQKVGPNGQAVAGGTASGCAAASCAANDVDGD
ncbi:hypothetical protein LPB41_29385 [Thalassospira sp. MA62]|nr:hypothetical protein [Thalassospira sp. MA62]